jgi:hypothetical protein
VEKREDSMLPYNQRGMLEILVIFFILIFVIAYLFYKHRRSDLEILQLENEQIPEQLSELLEELQPVVIRGVNPPKGLTRESLRKIPRLADFSVGGQPLADVLQKPEMLFGAEGAPTLKFSAREQLAKELSISVWADHVWLPVFSQSTWVGPAVGCMRTEAILGGLGMTRTTAKYTCIMPTEGKYTLSILSRESESFLPSAWQYRYPSALTLNDTPLVADLKYIDIVLRPGTTVCLPPHCVISIEPIKESSEMFAAVFVEYHEPISLLVKSFSQN